MLIFEVVLVVTGLIVGGATVAGLFTEGMLLLFNFVANKALVA